MAPDRVHLVLVKPEDHPHSEAFRELFETLQFGFRDLGIPVSSAENVFDNHSLNIALGWHLLAPNAQLPTSIILYNLEQMDECNRELRTRLAGLSDRAEIWDYSLRNIEILRTNGFSGPIHHVPIGYVPEMTRIKHAPVQDIDVLFYGSVNPRRAAILHELERRGAKVHAAFGVYGMERDALIARAKIVLNMHFYDSSIFEMVRVSYLLANCKMVVAECNASTEVEDDLKDAAALVPYEQLAPTCLGLLRNPEARRRFESRALEAMTARHEAKILHEVMAGERLALPASIEAVPRKAPAVSVVLLTRNRPGFLRRALESLLTQTFRNFETLVVNDGGEDVSGVVAEFREKGLDVALKPQPEQRGQSAGRNLGIRCARGRWIAYLDDDDLYHPDHLETLVETLVRTGAMVAYTDSTRVVEEEVDGEWVALSRELAMSHDFDRDHFLRDNITPVINVMHERSCWEICGPHDETLPVLEDWDYWIRLSRNWDFVHIPKVTAEVRWRKSGANITFERQHLFPECRRRIAEKIQAMLVAEGCAQGREAFLYEPEWDRSEWAEVLLSFLTAFLPGEPVALMLLMDPKAAGQVPLDEARARVLDLVARTGRESFPDVILIDQPSEMLETLRPFSRFQWVPRGRGHSNGLEGANGRRLGRVRAQLVEGKS